MIHVVPERKGIFQQKASTVKTNWVQTRFILELILTDDVWVDSLVVKEESIVFRSGVFNWKELKKVLKSWFALLGQWEGRIDQSDSCGQWIKRGTWRQKTGGKITPKPEPQELEFITFPYNTELILFRAEPVYKFINNWVDFGGPHDSIFIIDGMRLPRQVKQDKSCILAILKYLLAHRYILNKRVKDILEDKDVLKGLAWFIVAMHHRTADHTERNCGLLVADQSVEDEGALRYDLGVGCQLWQSLQSHLRAFLYSVPWSDDDWRVAHEFVEMRQVLWRKRYPVHTLRQICREILLSCHNELLNTRIGQRL
jgi:hypothetical protein